MNKKISWMMVIILTVTIIGSHIIYIEPISAAIMDKLKWKKNDTMDTSMNVVQNKTGNDDILLECDLEDTGIYTLEYFLEDKIKTKVIIQQQFDHIDIYYKVLENQGDPANPVNITQNLLDVSYLEMNYSADVPDWVYDGSKTVDADPDPEGEAAIKYTVERSASAKYPGIAFEIANKRVIIKWDFQTDKLYYLMTGYKGGLIMPVTYSHPSAAPEVIKVLKLLEDFKVDPRYLKEDGGVNNEVTPIMQPDVDGDGVNDSPGGRPALEITFKQPKELDLATWGYSTLVDMQDIKAFFEISDIASDDYLDFNFDLSTGSTAINSLPNPTTDNQNVVYQYTGDTYKILIVKDKSDLTDKNTIIQWDDLAGSKIYNVEVNFQVSANFDDNEFKTYLPQNKFAYTYMEYFLKRVNTAEAFLDITPYNVGSQAEVEYTILYSKVVKPVLDKEEDLWVKHYYISEDCEDHIYIPVDFNKTNNQAVYQIIVNFANTDIYSQVLNYNAGLDTNVPPTTPNIEDIDNLYVVPSQNSTVTEPIKAQFDLTWTAPTNKTVKELDNILKDSNDRVFYELMVNDLPTNTTENPFEVIKVFEVYKDNADGLYKVKKHDDVTGDTEAHAIEGFQNGYNSEDELFRMDNINLFSNTAWTKKITTVVNETTNTYTVTETAQNADILYPGVNYLKVRAITRTGGKVAVSYESIPVSLSLSPIKYNVPIVDELTYSALYGATDSDPLGISLYWDSIEIEDYEKHMLYPVDREIDNVGNKIMYSVYISEDKDALLELKDTNVDYNLLTLNSETVDISADNLTMLRNKEVGYFVFGTTKDTNTRLNVDIKGLDKNTNYYVRVRANVETQDIGGGNVEVVSSEPSSILSTTTPIFPTPPGDDEINPLAPEDLEVEFTDDSKLSATLTWDMPESMTFKQDTFGFEIFAIENRSIPSELFSRDTIIEDILKSEVLKDDVMEAWRLYVEDDGSGGDTVSLKKYNEETDTWDIQDNTLFDVDLPQFTMQDASNTPNKVNYYYVRSIKIEDNPINDVVQSASSWTKNTLTTAPVKEPINLIVDYSGTYTSDEKTQAIIRFDAPVPDSGSLATEYIMEIYVKGEDDLDYSLTKYPAVFVDEESEGLNGYRRLYYRISELDPGEKYNIKVRIEDRTKEQEILPGNISQYPKSPFSLIVTTRTDFDQEDYDKENKYIEYIKYYETKAEELKQVSYFVLESTSSKNVIKYRDDYALGEIKRSNNSEYTLAIEDKDRNIIYLPAKFIEEVNSNKVTLKIQCKNQIIGIRPFSLGIDITDEINEIIEDINKYNSDIVDYYIRITIDIDDYSRKISSKEPISDLVEIEIEVIGSEETEQKIDIDMISELEWAIEHNKSELISDIEDELDDGINDEKLLDIVRDMLEEVKSDYMDLAEDIMDDTLEDRTSEEIDTLNKNMFISLTNYEDEQDQDSVVYMKDGSDWEKTNSTYYANSYYVDTDKVTSYILIPKTAGSSKIYNMYSSEETNVINKYELTEIFLTDELLNKSTSISKEQLISSYSRLLGAEANYDNLDFLKEKGIDINSSNIKGSVKRDEALSAFVQVFALRNNVYLNTVNILDYNIIEDISQVDTKYRNNLIIGANLGIIELENGNIYPKTNINIEETLTILTRIEEGIDW